MKAVAGIVSEYNIFHSGHEHQIRRTRELLGGDCGILCVMSGNFVQRGDFAIMEKHARARCALAQKGRDGADLVIELPTPYALSSAQGFARGAVGLLENTGICTHLSFGSEGGELPPLQKVVSILETKEFDAVLKEKLALGISYAAARQAAVKELAGDCADVMSQPNSILGIEYLSALASLNSTISPVTVRRLGAMHDERSEDPVHISASFIRELLLSGDEVPEKYLPKGTAEVLKSEMAAGRFPASEENCRRAILAVLRRLSEEDFIAADGSNEGLHRRIMSAVENKTSFSAVADAAKTKRFARSRICRTVMRAYLGIPENMSRAPVPYIKVLAFNSKGREMLRAMEEAARLPVITKPAHGKKLEGFAAEIFSLECRCTDSYCLAYPNEENCTCGQEMTRGVEMVLS